MSRPRVSRTVAGTRSRSSTAVKARSRSAPSRRTIPVGLYGIRFTLKIFGSSSRASSARLLDAVVDAGEHHVLDEHLAAAQLEVAAALGEHLVERIAVVDRHQLAAERVGRRVQREREPDRLVDLVDEAARARAASRRSRPSCAGA